MKEINITQIDELLNLDLSNYKVDEDVSIDIKLRLENQTIEFPITIIHNTPGKNSKVSIKLALYGQSKAIIPVEMHVRKGAINTSTDFKALVYIMSPTAHANVTPGLFIEEKDIQSASHGVVIKNIKDKDLVYLQARGIVKAHAKEMIVQL